MAISSQLNQKKGLKTIDIFERTRAKTYTMPQPRKWTTKEAIPAPIYVNLDKVAKLTAKNGGRSVKASPA